MRLRSYPGKGVASKEVCDFRINNENKFEIRAPDCCALSKLVRPIVAPYLLRLELLGRGDAQGYSAAPIGYD